MPQCDSFTLPAGAETVVAADPVGQPNPALVAAARRAGGTGLLDAPTPDAYARAHAELTRRRAQDAWLRPGPALDAAAEEVTASVVVLELAGRGAPAEVVERWTAPGRRLIAQVTSRAEAVAAVDAGFDGLLASGCEAGGRVGPTESFILLQQTLDLGLPVWLRGGVGLHTAAAVVAGGGAGVVLDTQLGLLRESLLDAATRSALAAMDGSETRVVAGWRFFTRPDLPAARLPEDASADEVADLVGASITADLVPFGQDSATAAGLAERFVTVGGVVQGITASITEHLAAAATAPPLAPGAGVSVAHGTVYPIAQGPMTRVSDRAGFAAAVAGGGGLPFLALALMPGHEVRALLTETKELLGDRAWGVGLLGFAPPELLAEQLAVVHEVAPPFALVAGGRPSQSAALDAAGIPAYLHVPSPGLLDRFLADGARAFVFEGRECGGHVGPRSSFALWEAQIERLMAVDDPENLRVLLAGGVHDARSAAMAGAALAPLAAKGAQVGVLMGTAYLFTAEAVAAGAIQPAFQEMAVDCDTTVLLETAPGHATRCVETDFVRAFAARRDELVAAGVDAKERWAELEQLNLGRLRIASKGLTRGEQGLEEVDVDQQRAEGMYMIGEVATLRHEVTSIEDLHADVSAGSAAWALPGAVTEQGETPEADPFDIAIVGMESFFPGAVGAEQFWANVVAGTDHVTEVPADRWETDLYFDAEATGRSAGHKTPSKWGGFIDPVGFDPLAYGIPPASLAAIEPVQLLSLEVAARALADAGYATRDFDRERASVVFGAESGNELGGMYGVRAFLPQLLGEVPEELQGWLPTLTEDSFPGVLANVIAGRIANRLDLGGVNYTVDAACGSSLAALDAACKELRTGASDLVIAGGADLHNGLNDYLMFSSVHALSPSGRCRTFDASADGIALGEGIAAVVLKRRVDAERDGDRIYAIIDAVAGSSDGRHLGLTAPRKEGQQRAVVRALEASGVDLHEVGLVEAHGTGTVVGDRTEMATLTELFAQGHVEAGSVVLGSVKSQIGHTKCAAGLAGLIKVAKAVHHGVLPPTINLVEPNPYYEAGSSPFRFHDKPRPWAAETRRAGVSAFGFGGTNFHAVVSSCDAGDRPAHGLTQWPAELFVVRGTTEADAARSVAALRDTVTAVAASDPDAQRHRLRDLAWAVARQGRGPVRAAFVASSFAEVLRRLDEAEARGFAAPDDAERGQVAFLYPGQGSQRPGMLNDLFVTFGGLDDLLREGAEWAEAMFPPAAFTKEQRAAQQAAITSTDVAQPTLGIAAVAMTRLLARVGIAPDVAAGHSYGELAALAAAGTFDDATLLSLSAARGGAVLTAVERSGGDPGTMAAVSLTLPEVTDRLAAWPDVVVANHNAPRQVVVSGPTNSVRAAVEALEADGVRATLLPVACAFHSPLVAEASSILAEHLEQVDVAAPAFPVWSNTTAEPYPSDPAAVRSLLADQVADGVRFVDQVESMYAAGVRTFVEAGPGRVLSGQVAKILGDRPHTVIACEVPGEPGVRRFLEAVAQLTLLGAPVDETSLFAGRADVVDLRTWPLKAPGWSIDGAFVRRADGSVLPNSLQPAGTMPALAGTGAPAAGATIPAAAGATPAVSTAVPAAVPATGPHVSSAVAGGDGEGLHMPAFDEQDAPAFAGTGADAVVHEYLRSMRQVVAAERDVLLRYLGAPAVTVATSNVVTSQAIASPVTTPVAAQVDAQAPVPAQEPAATVSVITSPVSAVPVAAVPAAAVAAAPAIDLMAAVQKVVSERTGYPVDMLEPDLDLEADLSIDSIKRIEIVGELAERIGLGSGGTLADDVVEELSRHKTLRAIVDWVTGQVGVPATTTAPAAEGPAATSAAGAAVAPPAVVPASTAPAPAPAVDLMAAVQKVVSERTGYPVDMLEPDLDLEADLSIDSIKRIEIVGELAERIGLGSGGTLADDVVEELSRHKTLRAIVAWIESQSGAAPAAPAAPVAVRTPAAQTAPTGQTQASPKHPTRTQTTRALTSPTQAAPAQATAPTAELVLPTGLFELTVEPLGPTMALGDLTGASVALVEGHRALTDEVDSALTERGAQVARLTHRQVGEHQNLLGQVDVLVDLSATAGEPFVDARTVFGAVQPSLLGRAGKVLAVDVALHAPGQEAIGVPTGVPGMFRSLAREYPDRLLRSVEVDAADLDGDLAPLAGAVVDELLDVDAPPSLSWAGGRRTTRVAGEVRRLEQEIGALDLTSESVVVLTGGARGITARIAEGLARTARCRLVLVGRSPYPTEAESPLLAGARTLPELRRRVLEIGEVRTPAEVERVCAEVLASREVIATLETLRSLGADAEYVAMDVRSPGFGALLDALHTTFGRLDGVIHGAGVLDDRLVRDKSAEGFDRVFGTKVDSARAILDRQHLGLKFVALFGSISGVFGNKGQVDYAAANDALDALARAHDGRHGCRVLSLDWGPWAGGGMVSPELEREYARRGVGLLPPADGVRALLQEVASATGPSQVVVMAGSPDAFATSATPLARTGGVAGSLVPQGTLAP
ncbi:type I polyketide synthase [Nocardioides jishulii]|uniref:Acyltransferase domain-containing protein n=1 Tax=Nocardioides jishulii TaxID=2575440 RepID=A0A4U2YTP2_9ACTN|nr:type I polyketide synthase [Nocardioides jishulii]QCX28868.1 acyltransferase domain-containing protein [Nocardioides jishulii]TKI64235.1 acyltransferase domain-containing protein [Nocardioides jishulii]